MVDAGEVVIRRAALVSATRTRWASDVVTPVIVTRWTATKDESRQQKW